MFETVLAIGKFMPPHKGHDAMLSFASQMGKSLFVAVDSVENEPWPAGERAKWISSGFPAATVFALNGPTPQDPSSDGFWAWWCGALVSGMGCVPSALVCSMPYGKRLASELGCRLVPFDMFREGADVSATVIRDDPFGRWDSIAWFAKPFLRKRVLVCGAESSGKSVMASFLAQRSGCGTVPEYARSWISEHGLDVSDAWFESVAAGQAAFESAFDKVSSGPFLFLDTDVFTTRLWARKLLGNVPPAVSRMAGKSRRPDFALLLSPEVGWVPDVHRTNAPAEEKEAERRWFHDEIRKDLVASKTPFVEICGPDFDSRALAAAAAVDRFASGVSRSWHWDGRGVIAGPQARREEGDVLVTVPQWPLRP